MYINSDFGKVDPGSYDAVLDCVTAEHPLYDRIHNYYDSISTSVKKHSKLPSFFAKSTSKAQEIDMEWTGSELQLIVDTASKLKLELGTINRIE